MKVLKYTLFFSFVLIIACTKPPDYPDEPVIEFKNFSKNILQQGYDNSDSLLMTLSFTDGDGDIGDKDSLSIFFIDTRDNTGFLKYKIPFVPEQGTGNGISGEISIAVFNSCCILPDTSDACIAYPDDFPTPTDTLIYNVYIMDRAGNKSNVIQSDPIILVCDPI